MKKVLLIHPGAMGDLIQALPAFERIRARFAADRITLLTGSPFAGLARGWAIFDEVIAFDAATAYRGSYAARAALFLALARRSRADRYDAVGVFKASPVYAALAFVSGAPVRAGLTRGGGARLLTAPLTIRPDEHREDRFLRVAAALGASGAPPVTSSRWPADEIGLRALGPEQRALLIGIAPGGARNVKEEMPERRWPLDRYVELASRLLARHPAHLVILGGPDDRADAEAVVRRLPAERVTNLAGETTVAGAREVIAACRLFVTHDSGLLHVAGATQTPLVAIFGPTSPHVVCARRPAVRAVWHPARREPCHDELTGSLAPCVQPCCIDRCSVDEVLEQASVLLHPTLSEGG